MLIRTLGPRAPPAAVAAAQSPRRRLALGAAEVQTRRQVGVRRDPERRAERPDQLHLVRLAAVRGRRRGDGKRVEQVVLPPADPHAALDAESRELHHRPRLDRAVGDHRVDHGVVALGAQRGQPPEVGEPGGGSARWTRLTCGLPSSTGALFGTVSTSSAIDGCRSRIARKQPGREDQVADALRAQHEDRVRARAPVRRLEGPGVADGRRDRAHERAAHGALDTDQTLYGHPT